MVNNTTDLTAATGINLSDPYVLGITVAIMLIVTLIIGYSFYKWGSDYIKLSPTNRPNLLNFMTVLVLILAIIIFGLTKNIDSDAITTLIGAIAGYIFGVTVDPRLIRPKGLDSKPFAKIKINGIIGGEDKSISVDGISSIDPAGNPLGYNWKVSIKPTDSIVTPEMSTEVSPTFKVSTEGTYEITLIVNNGLQGSDPETVQVNVS